MKITIVYDNTTTAEDLIADWGFACVIELSERTILFDTGGNGKILFENMCKLNIDPTEIDDIVISHPDFDHIGGLSHLLNVNSKAIIHNPISFRGIKYSNRVKYYAKPTEIYPDIFVTGELENREQSLALRTSNRLSLIVGCAHPGLATIMQSLEKYGSIKQIIGGLHSFDQYDLLQDVALICPTHCSKNKQKIEQIYPDKYQSGGVGKELILAD